MFHYPSKPSGDNHSFLNLVNARKLTLKPWFRLALGACCLLLSTACLAGPWYAELAYLASDGGLPSDGDAPPVFAFDTDNTDSGWKLSAGYEVGQHFAIEIAYAEFGEQKIESLAPAPTLWFNPGTFPSPPLDGVAAAAFVPYSVSTSPMAIPPQGSLSSELTGLQLSAVGRLPLSESFSLSLQAGAVIPDYQVTVRTPRYQVENGELVLMGYNSDSETSNDPELFAGLGVFYSINDSFGIELNWEKLLDVGGEDTFEQDIDTYNLGLRYSF